MIIDGASLYFDTTETFQYRRFAESLSSKEKVKMVSDSRKRTKSTIIFPIGLMRLAGKKPHEQQNFA